LAGYADLARRVLLPDPLGAFPFATWFRPSRGVDAPVQAKVLLLRDADGAKLLFVGLELVAVTAGFRADLADALRSSGFEDEDIHVFASHTHSGPSGLSDNPFWQVTATDRFQPRVYAALLQLVADLSRDAGSRLEPAILEARTFATTGLQRNRRIEAQGVDAQARLVVARRPRGGTIGGFINYALHGTALRSDNLRVNADAPGAVAGVTEDILWERTNRRGPRPTILFLSGRAGDVNPARMGSDGVEFVRRRFGEQLSGALAVNPARRLEPHWRVGTLEVPLGNPSISSRNCLLGSEFDFLSKLVPHVRVERFFPKVARVWHVDLGGLPLALWPGEPTTRLGELLAEGREKPWIVSLADDYLAYFTTPEEYASGGYETCLNFYGPEGGIRLVEALGSLVSASD
jgi:hypothetical protein